MPKLYFRYGTMNSSKSSNLLMVAYNYISQCRKIILIKPKCDTRFGKNEIISSRALEGIKADILLEPDTCNFYIENGVECVLVDECQFLSEKNVEGLRLISQIIPVICYGLRTDYKGKLFIGSKRLMEIADEIEEIKTICINCNNKAIMNAKYYRNSDGKKIITKEGNNVIELGSEEKYQPMCWKCWKNS